MRSRVLRVLTFAVLVTLPAVTSAQFGHPLKGAWSGQWGPAESPNRLLLRIDWDGKQLSGVINPGANAATITSITIDYSNPSAWGVKMQAEGKDASGNPVPITVEGTLENLGAYYRVFHGTWAEGNRKGEFTVTRN